MKIFCSKYAG